MTAPIILAVVSDVHAGSTLAVCPPEGVAFDDGGRYVPSKGQRWLWENWCDYWQWIAGLREQHGATLGVLCNGDAVDGPGHHDTHQSISPNNAEAQSHVIERVFSVPKAIAPDWWVIVKGTESHVGKGADAESGLARSLGAKREPTTGAWSWYEWRADLHGVRIHATHHGRTGGRPWTQASAVGILATEILVHHAQAGVPAPHLAIRSHKHTPADSGDLHPVRVLATPAWQMMTAFGHKVVPEWVVNSVYGGYAIVIHPDGRHEVLKRLYRPDPAPVWRPRADHAE